MHYTLLTDAAIAICFTFTFVNGFHDGCNVMATIVSSRTMLPGKALLIACITEFSAPLLLGTAVANTVGKGILDINRLSSSSYKVSLVVILSALIGAILWNLFTWKTGFPSSSSHALIGGLAGSGAAIFGAGMVNWSNLFWKVIVVLFLTPFIGFAVGYLFIKIINKTVDRCNRSINIFFKTIQAFSMIFLASSHSSNDAQKSMGVVAIILVVSGVYREFTVPVWAIIMSSVAISSGLSLGGWTIVKTVGTKIFRIKPIHSFNSQLSAALVIMAASLLGSPVSTSQIVSSSIMGTGTGERLNAVNWGIVKGIIVSWIITIPCTAAIAAIISVVLRFTITK